VIRKLNVNNDILAYVKKLNAMLTKRNARSGLMCFSSPNEKR
jgi:hypothetical protein